MYGMEAGQINEILEKARGGSKLRFGRAAERVKIDNVYGLRDSGPYSRISVPFGPVLGHAAWH